MIANAILVTGGAGFIGSHVAKMLALRHYYPIVFDNLSNGSSEMATRGHFIKGDLANAQDLDKVFKSFDIKAVMHFAAFIDVGESVTNPGKYYTNNLTNTLNLLEAMRRHHVDTLVFSSSAAIFGIPIQERIDETHPCQPISPYGTSKLMVEKILHDYDIAYGIKSSCLRYFNAAGGDPDGEVKNFKNKETNLIPLILRSLLQNQEKPLKINGTDYPTPDGTCIRDYIHIEDLGMAHILTLEKLLKERCSTQYNLGNGIGFSIRDVIHAAEIVTKRKLNVIESTRRPGDPAVLVADCRKAERELGWKRHYPDLEIIIAHAWQALHPEDSLISVFPL